MANGTRPPTATQPAVVLYTSPGTGSEASQRYPGRSAVREPALLDAALR